MTSANNRINCRSCLYYFITWEHKTPHGCRAMGFKSRMMPSYEVRRNSGVDCRLYKKKP